MASAAANPPAVIANTAAKDVEFLVQLMVFLPNALHGLDAAITFSMPAQRDADKAAYYGTQHALGPKRAIDRRPAIGDSTFRSTKTNLSR